MPNIGDGAILITSRDLESQYSLAIPGCKVECFDSMEAKEFLLNQLPATDLSDEGEIQAAERVISRLGGLPLGIKQMGNFLRESGCTFDALFDLLKDSDQYREIAADSTAFACMDYNHTLASVWAISLSRLDEPSLNLLRMFSFLDPDSISGSVITDLKSFASSLSRFFPIAASTAKYHRVLSFLQFST